MHSHSYTDILGHGTHLPMKTFARRRLDGIEIASVDCSGHAFPPHFHDEFVIGLNISGLERIRLDRKDLEADACEITLYNPGQVQSSFSVSQEWRYLCIYVEPGTLADLFGVSQDTVFDRPVLQEDDLAGLMETAIRHGLRSCTGTEEARETVIEVLDRLVAAATKVTSSDLSAESFAIWRAKERLRDSAEMPTLADLASEAELTPVQLVRQFSRAFGLPPMAWAMNEKVNQARRRIAGGEALAAVAADLGFADQAHLTRRFRALHGLPPGRWARS